MRYFIWFYVNSLAKGWKGSKTSIHNSNIQLDWTIWQMYDLYILSLILRKSNVLITLGFLIVPTSKIKNEIFHLTCQHWICVARYYKLSYKCCKCNIWIYNFQLSKIGCYLAYMDMSNEIYSRMWNSN